MRVNDIRTFRATFNYSDSDWVGTVALRQKIKTHVGQPPSVGLSLALFNEIVTWKLAGQEDRTRHHRAKLTDDLVRKITACAFSLTQLPNEGAALCPARNPRREHGSCFSYTRTHLSRSVLRH